VKISKVKGVAGSILIAAVVITGYIIFRSIYMIEKELVLNNTSGISSMYYKNPVGNINDIGDPFVLKASDGHYYCYPTSGFKLYRAWESKDLVEWVELGPVYRGTDSWGFTDFWAPEVVEYNSKYYMYYTARWNKNNSLRIGVAVSDSPRGPFKDIYDHPLFDFGYAAIDANVLIDEDGKKYLFYSRDCSENVVDGRHESHIYGIELNDDMISIKGEPVLLIKPEQGWEKVSGVEWRWNEGPTVFKHSDIYYMMYSANFYSSKEYSIGYATAKSPLGAYAKYDMNPIVQAESEWEHVSGPGHNSITTSPDGKERFIVYHTHTDPKAGGGDRQVFIDRMGFREDGSIYVNGPTVTEQPLPSGSTERVNIAGEAKITISSTKIGYKENALIDGEIGIYEKSEQYEWAAKDGKNQAWISLEWDSERTISTILMYKSALKERAINSCKVKFSTGDVISNIAFPEEPGAAAVVDFPEINVKWVKVILDKAEVKDGEPGLSEIMIYGASPK
jgi:GH43 family beta-xylosidase